MIAIAKKDLVEEEGCGIRNGIVVVFTIMLCYSLVRLLLHARRCIHCSRCRQVRVRSCFMIDTLSFEHVNRTITPYLLVSTHEREGKVRTLHTNLLC